MTRYREISSAEMTSAQKEVHDEIVAGRRGRFGGPFQILIRAPEVCHHLQRLGEYLRWGSSLAPALEVDPVCETAGAAC
jgi:4-carboxymuconolactone decarboxylase